MRARAVIVGALIAALAFAGCTAEPDRDPTPEPSEPSMTSAPLESVQATLAVHAGAATVQSAAATADAATGDVLAEGDVIAVAGENALIELTWSDGAITRLGDGSSFTVGAPAASGERGRQAGGLSWNRMPPPIVDELSARVAAYVVLLDGDDHVSDRGELFVVDCRDALCRVTGAADPPPPELCESDPGGTAAWVDANVALDELAGFVPIPVC